jgi:radical SAM family uncharacterized protein
VSSVWSQVEPLLARVERPTRYLDGEWGTRFDFEAPYRVALVYPDVYEVGMANQALQILYSVLNTEPTVACDRAFLPWKDMADAMRAAAVPLFGLESCEPLGSFDLVGITLPYELTYTNVLEALDLAGIALYAADRAEGAPLVIGGGPCAYNPEPVAPFFDAILIGDGEEAVVEIVAAHCAAIAAGGSRAEAVASLATIEGVYVPSIHVPSGTRAAAPLVRKRLISDLDAHRSPVCPVVPYMDVVHDRVALEVLRGCARGCRFCQAGMVYRPVRERSADSIVRDAVAALTCTGYEEVSLTSLSTADHSELPDVLRRLSRRLEAGGISISVPSLRVDSFSPELARLLSGGRKTGLTFAPEAGTQRLRDVINKNVTQEQLLETTRKAFSSGWRRVKLYFMLGLPTETDDDIAGIGSLVARVLGVAREATPPAERGGIRVGVSVSTFVPKAHTPFQWEPQLSTEEVRRRQGLLRASMPRKGVELSWHDPDVSFLEGILARGGREVSAVVEGAWRRGARFDAWTDEFRLDRWTEALIEAGIDGASIANRERDIAEPLPWSHLSAGLSTPYLLIERSRALAAETTPDCTFDGCTGCGVCGALGVENVIVGGVRA